MIKIDSFGIFFFICTLLFLTGCVGRKYGEIDKKSFSLQMRFNTFDSWYEIPKIQIDSIVDNGIDITNQKVPGYNASYSQVLANLQNYNRIYSDKTSVKIGIKKIDSECKNLFVAYTTGFLSVITVGLIPFYSVDTEKYVILSLFPGGRLGELYFDIKTQTYASVGILGVMFGSYIWFSPPKLEYLGVDKFVFDRATSPQLPFPTLVPLIHKSIPIRKK